MIRRTPMIYLGVRQGGDHPWYLAISEAARREVQLPYHRKLRVRMTPGSSPIILPVEPYWKQAASGSETLVPIAVAKNKQGIVLGPIVGIMTVRRRGANGFRGNRANFRDIVKMGQRLNLTVAVFTPDSIHTHGDKMEGYVYTGNTKGTWKRMTLPLPAVVYNRVPDREAEQSAEVAAVKKWLKERKIPLFNHGFFDKQQLHDWLSQDPETSDYLPYTELLRQESQLRQMIRRHPLLYVKPVDGRAGDGIIQIRTEGGVYHLTCQRHGKRTREEYKTRQEAVRAVWRRTRGRAYLLQQGIELAMFGSRMFDLRMLVQKNRFGHWRISGMGARVADEDGITTHVPNGGEIEKALRALKAAFGNEKGAEIWRNAREMALTIAETIERQTEQEGQHLGELSMDIGVDREGGLWFFEANAKPMKFDEPFIRAKSLLRLLHYCEYVARHP